MNNLVRMNVRNFFMCATKDELEKEIKYRSQNGNPYDAETVPYLQELLDELEENS